MMGLFNKIANWLNTDSDKKESTPVSGSQLSPETEVNLFTEATAWALAGVNASESVKQQLSVNILQSFKNNNHGLGDKVIEQTLSGYKWEWTEFERWRIKFEQDGVLPTRWKDFASSLTLPAKIPQSTGDALGDLTVVQIKTIMKDCGIKSPSKANKQDLISIAAKEITVDTLMKRYADVFDGVYKRKIDDRKSMLCNLLSQHIRERYYSLSHLEKQKRSPFRNHPDPPFKFIVGVSQPCPIVQALSDGYNTGKTSAPPPFFPADGAHFIPIRNNR